MRRRPPEPAWTVEALRVHLSALIEAVEAKHDVADVRTTEQYHAARADLNAAIERVATQIQGLTDRLNRAEGALAGAKESKAGLYALIAAIGVVITIVVAVASILNGQGGG